MVVQGVKVIKGATDFSDVRHDDEENIDESLFEDEEIFIEDDDEFLQDDVSFGDDGSFENDLNGDDEL